MRLPRFFSTTGVVAGLLGGALLGGGVAAVALTPGDDTAPASVELTGSAADIGRDGGDAVDASALDGTGQDDSRLTGSTSTTAVTAPRPTSTSGTRVVDAFGAGTVTVNVDGGNLTLVSAVPAAGWTVEVEQAAGREIEVDFRSGTRRVQVNLEFEDGAVRERVRVRDEANDAEIRIENGVIVRQEPGDEPADDDAGSGHSGPGGDDVIDDGHSGHGGGN